MRRSQPMFAALYLSDWIGDVFDPQTFPIDLVNRKLAPKRQRSNES